MDKSKIEMKNANIREEKWIVPNNGVENEPLLQAYVMNSKNFSHKCVRVGRVSSVIGNIICGHHPLNVGAF